MFLSYLLSSLEREEMGAGCDLFKDFPYNDEKRGNTFFFFFLTWRRKLMKL
jgi:hypothetical protein